jgi:Zn ribbon nucleic-acid-binding protein
MAQCDLCNAQDEIITWYDIDTWHCRKCDTYIDDKTEEMEMHDCKQKEVE